MRNFTIHYCRGEGYSQNCNKVANGLFDATPARFVYDGSN